MRDTMRDILNKLYSIVSESQLNPRDPKGDYEAKKQALDDLEADPVAGQDPEISAAIDQRRSDLEKEAQSAGIFEVGDDFGISFSEDFEIAAEIVDILEDGIVIELDDTALEMLAIEGLEFLEGELEEGVAGPKSCWKGYRKVGTKPGTGKNAGKRVNDCEKIGEGSIEEYGDTAKGQKMLTRVQKRAVDRVTSKKADTDPAYAKKNADTANRAWDRFGEKEKYGEGVAEGDVDEAKYQGREVPLGKKMAGDVKKSKVYVRKPNGNIVKVNFGDKKMRIKKSNPARRKSFRARHNCANPGPRHKARYWSCRSW